MMKITNSQLYGYADVGSYGLGHSLLAWGRCYIWCRKNNLSMLAPSWLHVQHRIGPMLRRERDNRQYHRLFYFDDYISGWRRLWLLKTHRTWSAESDDLCKLLKSKAGGVVVFRNKLMMNEEAHFKEIVGHGAELRSALENITRPQFRPSHVETPHIALHIRMGDFVEPTCIDTLRAGSKNSRLPLEWYLSIVVGVRNRIGDLPAVIYSDGDDDSLRELLCLPNVSRSQRQPSVSDMLSISQATVLISSGSGFSMWGSFLGDVPRICFPGQRFVRVLGTPHGVDREPEVETVDELPASFFEAISIRINSVVVD